MGLLKVHGYDYLERAYPILYFKMPRNVDAKYGSMLKIILESNHRVAQLFSKVSRIKKRSGILGVYIPRKIIDYTNLKRGDFVEVKIKRLPSVPEVKQSKIFHGDKIDLLALIPDRSKKNCEFFVEANGDKLLVLNPRTKRPITINRFAGINEFASLLGQLQAEGDKRPSALVFSNKSIGEHGKFVHMLKHLGVGPSLLRAGLIYNPRMVSEEDATRLVGEYGRATKVTEVKTKQRLDLEEMAGATYIFRSALNSSALAEILLHSMNEMRNLIANSEALQGSLLKFSEVFIANLLSGDGSLEYLGHSCAKLTLTDKSEQYREDYVKILGKLGFRAKPEKSRPNSIRFYASFSKLLYLYHIGAFSGKNRRRLIEIIGKSPILLLCAERLGKLEGREVFTSNDVQRSLNCPRPKAYSIIEQLRGRKLIRLLKRRYNPSDYNLYTLTEQGKSLLEWREEHQTGVIEGKYVQ